jgi:hypothetical protein
MRGLCFLIAELAHHVVGIHGTHGISRIPVFDWRSDAFFYRAFKTAVARLLDALEPPGPVDAHEMTVAKGIEPDSFTKDYIDSFKAPETRARAAIDFILGALRTPPHAEELAEIEARRGPSAAHPFYGIADATRDLAIKPESGDMVPVTFPLGFSLTGGATPVTVHMRESSFERLKKIDELKKFEERKS